MNVQIDAFVIDSLMRELVKEHHSPAAFLVYLFLWSEARKGSGWIAKKTSHQMIADGTGLSRSAVQLAIKLLKKLKRIKTRPNGKTGKPDHVIT